MPLKNNDRTQPAQAPALPPDAPDVLVVGIGNCGRADDGLGWAFLDQMEENNTPVDIAYRYQLQIEDAEFISHHPFVIFVDASEEDLPDGFQWRSCQPSGNFSYSSHELSPETIVGLCQNLYNATPKVYLLAIQGYDWGLREGLSREATRNLRKALHFFDAMML